MSLTKQQAQAKFQEQSHKRKNVEYLDRFDCASIYRAGKVGKEDNAFDNLRYYEDDRSMERFDRALEEYVKKTNEIITYVEKGVVYVLALSGGVSLFDGPYTKRKMGKNDRWHCVVNATHEDKKLDPALVIEKKLKANDEGLFHYSIQPKIDMSVKDFLDKLKEFAKFIKSV